MKTQVSKKASNFKKVSNPSKARQDQKLLNHPEPSVNNLNIYKLTRFTMSEIRQAAHSKF